MRYRDEKGNEYKVGGYLGNDPKKSGLFHVCKIDRNCNRQTPGPAWMNPWTTEEEAKENLARMAKSHGWKKA